MSRFLSILAFYLLCVTGAAAQTNVTWGLATGSNPRNLCVYDSAHTCVTTGALDSTLHVFTPSIPGGTITNSMLAVGAFPSITGVGALTSGSIGSGFTAIPNSALANSTISGVALGSNLNTLTFGSHLAAGAASYNGSAAATLTSDATTAATPSTIAARDASGNLTAANFFGVFEGLTISPTTGTLTVANGKTLTDTSGAGAKLLLGAAGGGFAAYAGTSSAGNVLTAISSTGAGSFLPYGTTGNSTLVETSSGGLIASSILPAATTSALGAVSTDGATIANTAGAISCRTSTSSLLGCASFGAGLTVTGGAVTPTFGTAASQVAQGGVITAGGPIGSATVAPVVTYNAAGQLTAVSSATITPAVGSITGLGSNVGSALGNALNASGGLVGYGGAAGNITGHASADVEVFLNVAALRAYIPPASPATAETTGYYSAGDGGGSLYSWNASSTATDDGGSVINPTSSGAGRWLIVPRDVTVGSLQFGAKGTGLLADAGTNTTAFQNAINYAQATGVHLHIGGSKAAGWPNIFILNAQLSITGRIDIKSDDTVDLNWSGASTSGVAVNFSSAVLQSTINLPNMYGPYTNTDNTLPGYPSALLPNSLTGTALSLSDCAWIRVSLAHLGGWQTGIFLGGSSMGVQNVEIRFNVMDFMFYGVRMAPTSTASINSVEVHGNTLWGKYASYTNAGTSYVGPVNLYVQTVYNDIPGGSTVYESGSNIYNMTYQFDWVLAGNDTLSPAGSGTFKIPYVTGGSTVNSQSGYSAAQNSVYSLGYASGIAPASGDPLRFQISGYNSRIATPNNYAPVSTPIALSQTQGEANFNGGVGAAAVGKTTPVSMTVSSLAAGATATFYFYHQGNTYDDAKSFGCQTSSGGTYPFIVSSQNNSYAVNREVKVYVQNFASTAQSGSVYCNMEAP